MSSGVHSLYPGFIKLYYTVATYEHVMTIPVKPFQDGLGAWMLEQKLFGAGVAWITGLNAFITAIKPAAATNCTFTYAELWTMSSPEADPLYVETALLAVVGTGGGVATPMSQVVFSGRSTAGGVVKLYMLETPAGVNQKLKPTYAAPWSSVVNYLLSSGSICFARDGGSWSAVPQITTKTNDELRKQRGLA